MNKLIIGAPFGNYIKVNGITSTLGTYTLHKRAGVLKRLWRALSTIRYYPKLGSWNSKLGLPSPGIDSLQLEDVKDHILSIHGFNSPEWVMLYIAAQKLNPLAIELNISCPNVAKTSVKETLEFVEGITNEGSVTNVIAKLPPVRWMDYAIPLWYNGITKFHLCNTITTPSGSLSGKILKQYSLWAVEEVKQKWGNDVTVIGGGGITEIKDIQDYLTAGVDHVAVASMLLNPCNYHKLREFRSFFKHLEN